MQAGRLALIGGAEDRRGDMAILRRVSQMAGEGRGNLVVIATATRSALEVAEVYRRAFLELGVGRVSTLAADDRQKASAPRSVDLVEEASAVFFTGGDQLRITSLLGGTPLDDAIRRLYWRGGLVAGTSAGASALGEWMVVEGPGDDCPRRCTIKLAPGLGLLRGAIVDQHFSQRGRLGRLLAAVAQNPRVLGIGVDEDSAITVGPDRIVEALGSGAVTIVDGREMDHVNVSEQEADKPLALGNVKLHVLAPGCRFDLKRRAVIPRRD